MKRTQLAKSIAMVLAGSALSVGAVSTASAHTMYNMFIPADSISGTDGWVYGFDSSLPQGTRGGSAANPISPVAFVGTGSQTETPFGYAGNAHLNWAAEIHYVGQTLEISTADSLARYGFAAEIDTGAGAWQDAGVDANGNPTANGPTGWKHQTDIGLIKSEVDTYIQLTPSVVTGTGYDIQNFGITVFKGMDTNTGNYSHHGAWNCPGCSNPTPYNLDNPFGTQGLEYVTHSGTVDANSPLTFFAEAGQIYSIYIGGAGVGRWNQNVADYQLNVAAVPVPAAVWFFGTALAGLMGFNRRNKATA